MDTWRGVGCHELGQGVEHVSAGELKNRTSFVTTCDWASRCCGSIKTFLVGSGSCQRTTSAPPVPYLPLRTCSFQTQALGLSTPHPKHTLPAPHTCPPYTPPPTPSTLPILGMCTQPSSPPPPLSTPCTRPKNDVSLILTRLPPVRPLLLGHARYITTSPRRSRHGVTPVSSPQSASQQGMDGDRETSNSALQGAVSAAAPQMPPPPQASAGVRRRKGDTVAGRPAVALGPALSPRNERVAANPVRVRLAASRRCPLLDHVLSASPPPPPLFGSRVMSG